MRATTVLLLLLLLAIPLAAANEHQVGEDHETEIEQETETREVSVEADESSVEIESKQENTSTGVENAFEVEFEADDQVEIKLKFKRGTEVNGSEQESELSYAVETEELIEFQDENSNQVYDDGEEVSRHSLEDADFQPINYTTRETPNGVIEHVITAESTDGVFAVTLHVVGSFAQIGATTVNPNEVKIDLAINEYPFEEDGTRLALISKLKTEHEVEREEDGQEIEREEAVMVRASDVSGFFSWKPTATVDGTEQPVRASYQPRDEAGERTISLSYPQGAAIIHDPRIGILQPTATARSSIIYAALAVLGAVAALLFWQYR